MKTEKVIVTSPVALTDNDLRKITEVISKATGKNNIDLKVVIDPTVLGGLLVQIGDNVIDLSIKGRLDKISESLANE